MTILYPKAFKQCTRKSVITAANNLSDFNQILETTRINTVNQSEEILDGEKDKDVLATLDYQTWLPFASKTYKISPNLEDYLIVKTIICPSEIPNRNGIAFPVSELVKFSPPPTNRMVYKAWTGCPVHEEHDNEVHEKAYGVIFDTSLHKIENYGGGKIWKVVGLIGIDKTKNPDIAQQILNGEINTYSMGCEATYFTCSYCGTQCTSKSWCNHIRSTKEVNWTNYKDYDGSSHLAFLNAHDLTPIEISIVKIFWIEELATFH
jgi:hypothetical protein